MAARDSAVTGKFEPPKLRFEIQSPGLPARTLEVRQDIVKIGKLSSSHIQIQDAAVSRVHAVIEVTPQGEVYIIDLGSSNGTYVNDERVSKQQLKTGDVVRLGQTRVTVIVGGDELNVTAEVGSAAAAAVFAVDGAGAPAAEPAADTAAPSPVQAADEAAPAQPPSAVEAAPEPPPAEPPAPEPAQPEAVGEPDLFAAAASPAPEEKAAEAPAAPPAEKAVAAPEEAPASKEEEKKEPEPAVSAAGPIGTPGPVEPSAPVLEAPPSVAGAKPAAAEEAPAKEAAAQEPPAPPPPKKAAPVEPVPAPVVVAPPRREPEPPKPVAPAVVVATPAAVAAKPVAPARPPEPQGRERRFIAITAAEPVSALTSRTVEARLAFGPEVIEARTFEAGRPGAKSTRLRGKKRAVQSQYRKAADVTIGPYPTCDFMIDVPGPFAVLRSTTDGFVFRFRDQTLGRVRLGERDVDLDELKKDPEVSASDEPGVYEWPFHQGALVSMKVGGTVLYLRSVPKAPPPKVVYFQTRDPRLLLAFLGVALFSGALVWRAVTWPATPNALLEDKSNLDDRMVSFLINPEERLRRAKIFGAKKKEEGGALKGKEGKSGTPDAPKRKRRIAIKGKQKELTPAQQRERDLRKVRRVGALAAMEKDAVLKEIFTGGAGGAPGSPFGRGVGQGADDMNAWGGVGEGGPGESYGLGGFGGAGTGTGGGGMGRYVGVGRLATRGIGGGRRGADIGSGRARFKEHQVEKPKVIMEEPDVGGGLTKEIIRRVIRSHLHEIRYCYERELKKKPSLYGKIVVSFTILPSGNVFKSRIKRTSMNNNDVQQCMLARVVRWKFPKPYKGSSVIVSYPFLFKSAGR